MDQFLTLKKEGKLDQLLTLQHIYMCVFFLSKGLDVCVQVATIGYVDCLSPKHCRACIAPQGIATLCCILKWFLHVLQVSWGRCPTLLKIRASHLHSRERKLARVFHVSSGCTTLTKSSVLGRPVNACYLRPPSPIIWGGCFFSVFFWYCCCCGFPPFFFPGLFFLLWLILLLQIFLIIFGWGCFSCLSGWSSSSIFSLLFSLCWVVFPPVSLADFAPAVSLSLLCLSSVTHDHNKFGEPFVSTQLQVWEDLNQNKSKRSILRVIALNV